MRGPACEHAKRRRPQRLSGGVQRTFKWRLVVREELEPLKIRRIAADSLKMPRCGNELAKGG
jgi:hypothetical protein